MDSVREQAAVDPVCVQDGCSCRTRCNHAANIRRSRELILSGLPVRVHHLRVTIPMIVLSLVAGSHIVRRDTNAAVVAPYGLQMIGSGRPGFQTLHSKTSLSTNF